MKVEWQKSFSPLICRNDTPRTYTGRVEKGLRTPVGEYRRPILEALYEAGREAPVGTVLDRVYDKMKDKLNEYDHQLLASGEIRWRNTVQWCRKDMVDKGLLDPNAPRGIWRLTAAGRSEVFRFREGVQ